MLNNALLPLFLMGWVLALGACEQPEPETEAEEVFKQWRQAYNEQDPDALPELVADPHKLNGVERSVDEYIAMSVEPIWDAFPDLTYNDVKVVASDDYVSTRVHVEGTGRGDFMGYDVEGESVQATQTVLVRVKDGKIDEFWADVDMLTFWEQLGVIESPYPGGE